MVALLTAILCLLLRNCTKRIKQEFLDTASVQMKTFAYYLCQIQQNTDFLTSQSEDIFMYNVIKKIYYRRPQGPQKRGPVAITTFATISNPALVQMGFISRMLFSELYKIMVKQVTFVGFRGTIVPIAPWIRPCLCTTL